MQGFHRVSRGKLCQLLDIVLALPVCSTTQASIGCLSQTRCTFSTAPLHSRHREVLRTPCARFNSAAHTQQKKRVRARHTQSLTTQVPLSEFDHTDCSLSGVAATRGSADVLRGTVHATPDWRATQLVDGGLTNSQRTPQKIPHTRVPAKRQAHPARNPS